MKTRVSELFGSMVFDEEQMRERLDKTALEMYGVENFTDMIADETICTEDPEQLLNFLSEVGHPVLSMEPFDM